MRCIHAPQEKLELVGCLPAEESWIWQVGF